MRRFPRPILLLLALLGCVSEGQKRVSTLEVEATIDGMRPADAASAGPLVVGLGGMPSDATASRGDAAQDPQAQTRSELEAHLRGLFGPSIVIGPDGRITKQYFLVGELGPTFL